MQFRYLKDEHRFAANKWRHLPAPDGILFQGMYPADEMRQVLLQHSRCESLPKPGESISFSIENGNVGKVTANTIKGKVFYVFTIRMPHKSVDESKKNTPNSP